MSLSVSIFPLINFQIAVKALRKFSHGQSGAVTVIARWSVGRVQLIGSLMSVCIISFPCVFYLSLVHFVSFSVSIYYTSLEALLIGSAG